MEYDRVFSSGKKITYHGMSVWLAAAPHPRLGCAISRKVGTNVQRNRFKRHIRAAFRTRYQQLPAADIVIATNSNTGRYQYRDIEDLFQIICDETGKSKVKSDG